MATMADGDKLRVLLPHWIEHNAQHAAEFRRWVGAAGGAGAEIQVAAAQMDAANAALVAALERLGGPAERAGADEHPHAHFD